MTMDLMIVEDEKLAQAKLAQAVKQYDSAVRIVATLGSVEDTVRWLNQNPQPDLILMDIQLSDGLSLSVFDRCSVTCPVIFTTAYDSYLMEAFSCNGIDYLLKPIRQEKLEAALEKYLKLKAHFETSYTVLANSLRQREGTHRKRLLVRKGIDFLSIAVSDTAYFYTAHKLVFLVDRAGKKYLLDRSLGELEQELDPLQFFRANRAYLIRVDAITRFKPYDKGKLLLELRPPAEHEVTVSQEKAGAFKEWIGR